jgi:hypothetical protein
LVAWEEEKEEEEERSEGRISNPSLTRKGETLYDKRMTRNI